jgi:hypothetical protein
MSAASVGTGTTPMQVTANVGSGGLIQDLELRGADLVGKNRYLQLQIIPGGALATAIVATVQTEGRYNSNTGANISTGTYPAPVVVADLS